MSFVCYYICKEVGGCRTATAAKNHLCKISTLKQNKTENASTLSNKTRILVLKYLRIVLLKVTQIMLIKNHDRYLKGRGKCSRVKMASLSYFLLADLPFW